jgi:hypothetical protein
MQIQWEMGAHRQAEGTSKFGGAQMGGKGTGWHVDLVGNTCTCIGPGRLK